MAHMKPMVDWVFLLGEGSLYRADIQVIDNQRNLNGLKGSETKRWSINLMTHFRSNCSENRSFRVDDFRLGFTAPGLGFRCVPPCLGHALNRCSTQPPESKEIRRPPKMLGKTAPISSADRNLL